MFVENSVYPLQIYSDIVIIKPSIIESNWGKSLCILLSKTIPKD